MAAIAKTLIPRNGPEPLQPIVLPDSGPQLMPDKQAEVLPPAINVPEAPLAPFPQVQPKVVQASPLDRQIANDQQRLEKIHFQQAHPWGTAENHPGVGGKIAHVLSVAGNIAGNIFAPGVMANIPGTQMNRSVQESNLAGRLNQEQEQQSQEKLQGAETTQKEQQTKAAEPIEISPEQAQELNSPELAGVQVAPSVLATLYKQHGINQQRQSANELTNQTRGEISDETNQIKREIAEGKGPHLQHVAGSSGGKEVFANYNPGTGQFTDQTGQPIADFQPSNKAFQGVLGQYAPMRLAGQLLNTAYNVNPALLPALGPIISHMLGGMPGADQSALQASLSAAPTGQPENAAGTPIGLRMPEAPTGATRSRGQFAESVLPSITDAQNEIGKLRDKLGPMSGRYNELATSKIGAFGPEFAGLQTTLHNVATAWMRLHANSDAARQDFVNQLKAAQDPDNLVAVLDSIDKQARDYVSEGKGKPRQLPGNQQGPKRPSGVPENAQYITDPKTGKKGWAW